MNTTTLTVGDIAPHGKHFRNIRTKGVFRVHRKDAVVRLHSGLGTPGGIEPCDLVFTAHVPAPCLLRRFDPIETQSEKAFVRAIDSLGGYASTSEAAVNALRAARDHYDAHQKRKCLDLLALVAELERNATGQQSAHDELEKVLFPSCAAEKKPCAACTLMGSSCALCSAGLGAPADMDDAVVIELAALLVTGAVERGYQSGESAPIDVARRLARERT